MNKNIIGVFFYTIVICILVISLSFFISSKFEKDKIFENLLKSSFSNLKPNMTIDDFAAKTGLNSIQIAAIFGKTSVKSDQIGFDGSGTSDIEKRARKIIAIKAEADSKNWIKIFIKFILWFLYIFAAFKLISSGNLDKKKRIFLYATAVGIFGIIMGSDPGPMGTIKDAIVLYASDGAVFLPRLAAMTIFLLTVVIFNKSICAWGCQAGTFQDLLFRINRNSKDTSGIIKQFKISFYISNTVRIIFFLFLTFFAFLYGIDIVEPIDPFKIFKPSHITFTGVIFLAVIIASSLFFYRPWCVLFCPFGLAGWILERFSIYKIKVDAEKCVSCGACVKSCPSDAMEGILYDKKIKPDCFSCGVCIEICPKNAIEFKRK